MNDIEIHEEFIFPSVVYHASAPNFLSESSILAQEYIQKAKQNRSLNEIFPVYMTEDFSNDDRIANLLYFINQTSWEILKNQGYDMDGFETITPALWAQEHHKGSGNSEHIHGFGSQISGFYILDCPEDHDSFIAFHDPRPAKKQINLPYKMENPASQANFSMYYKLSKGSIYLANSWLPHEVTRHSSNSPLTFIHFNVIVRPTMNYIPHQQTTEAIPSNHQEPTAPQQLNFVTEVI